jgi:hypothetical protein
MENQSLSREGIETEVAAQGRGLLDRGLGVRSQGGGHQPGPDTALPREPWLGPAET